MVDAVLWLYTYMVLFGILRDTYTLNLYLFLKVILSYIANSKSCFDWCSPHCASVFIGSIVTRFRWPGTNLMNNKQLHCNQVFKSVYDSMTCTEAANLSRFSVNSHGRTHIDGMRHLRTPSIYIYIYMMMQHIISLNLKIRNVSANMTHISSIIESHSVDFWSPHCRHTFPPVQNGPKEYYYFHFLKTTKKKQSQCFLHSRAKA